MWKMCWTNTDANSKNLTINMGMHYQGTNVLPYILDLTARRVKKNFKFHVKMLELLKSGLCEYLMHFYDMRSNNTAYKIRLWRQIRVY